MRPLRLRLEGFTCYRRPVEVDFQDLDLFAITGPTGAGKSSLVHGMTYALYGRVPGFGNEVKELISQGSDHLQVTFEFAGNGRRYVLTRRTARRGSPHVQLFRIGEDGTQEGLTDRARETEEKVRAIVGLDFDGFTRSVLLPQGQFHLFLAGEPRERRKVLAELLRLDIYEAIMRAANAEVTRCQHAADSLKRRLSEDFADATPAVLSQRKKRLKELESQAQELLAVRTALEEGRSALRALAGALERLRSAGAELGRDEAALGEASATAARGDEEVRTLDDGLRRVEDELNASPFQVDLHRRLQLALTPARERERALRGLQALRSQLAALERAAGEARERQASAAEEAARAQKEWQQAEAELEHLRHKHAAADLRRGLKPGEPCPVCDQPVAALPLAEHVALDEAEARRDESFRAAQTAAQGAEKAGSEEKLAQQRLATARGQLEEVTEDVERWRHELIGHLGLEEPPPRSKLEADWQAQEQARMEQEMHRAAE
ncbi:MAG: AAA family ATPase, partial [Dehalococcoidia bacterium]